MVENEDPITKASEKLKGMSLLRNIHKITPQLQQDQDKDNVAIVKALRSDSVIIDALMRLEGKSYNPVTREYEEYRNPVMNKRGIGNFIAAINNISSSIEFSSLREKEIPRLAKHFFKINYPYFTIYYEDYDLDRSDFNLIASILLASIISSLNKAKGSGHRNVIRGTYSEDLLGRYVEQSQEGQKNKSKFDLSQLNPFKKGRGF